MLFLMLNTVVKKLILPVKLFIVFFNFPTLFYLLTTHPGVGGFVLNSDNQLLVVQERFSCSPHWKLPGGHADLGSSLYHKHIMIIALRAFH